MSENNNSNSNSIVDDEEEEENGMDIKQLIESYANKYESMNDFQALKAKAEESKSTPLVFYDQYIKMFICKLKFVLSC